MPLTGSRDFDSFGWGGALPLRPVPDGNPVQVKSRHGREAQGHEAKAFIELQMSSP